MGEDKMQEIIENIQEYLDHQEEVREKILDISHKSIRKSSSAIAALHRQDMEKFDDRREENRKDIEKLNDILEEEPQFSDHGALIAAHREFSELMLTKALIEGEDIPDPDDLGVLYKGYAQALPETIGELRRHFLNLLLEDEVEEAQRIQKKMERIFDLIERFDYPDSILPGMKHRRDGARKTLEKTRADITRGVRERELEDILNETRRKLED